MDVGYRAGGFTLNIGGSYNDAEIRRDFCRIANAQFDCTLDPGDGRTNALLAPAGSRLPVTALSSDDLPTFDRPAKATSSG